MVGPFNAYNFLNRWGEFEYRDMSEYLDRHVPEELHEKYEHAICFLRSVHDQWRAKVIELRNKKGA